jgi:hypothetical protein
VIEYVSAKVPFCQIDKLTIYDGKYKFIRINYRLRLVYGYYEAVSKKYFTRVSG